MWLLLSNSDTPEREIEKPRVPNMQLKGEYKRQMVSLSLMKSQDPLHKNKQNKAAG